MRKRPSGHSNRSSFSVRRPVLLPLLGTLFCVMITFVFSTHWLDHAIETYILKQEAQSISRHLQHAMAEQARFFREQMTLLAQSDTLRRLFLTGDRAALLRESRPILDTMHENRVTHFCFHRPDGVNFLRVHQPDIYGDQIDRPTLLRAQQSGAFAFGAELGRVGTLTLRAVLPWREGSTVIGYLELGKEIEHFVAGLQAPFNQTFYTFLQREYLDASQWLDASRRFGVGLDWESFADLVFIGQKDVHYPDGLQEYIASRLWNHDEPQSTISDALGAADNHFFALPIRDSRERIVGRVIGVAASSQFVSIIHRYGVIVMAIVIGFTLLLGLFFNYLLTRVESGIQQTSRSLENAMQSRIAISAMLETGAASLSMENQLHVALEIILTVSWLTLEYKGSIFLVAEDGEHLVLATHVGLPPSLLNLCAQVPMGYCLCGRAALRREILFTPHIDHEHDVRFPEMQPHGHYCVPILFGDQLLGVLNLYVPDNYARNREEEAFLTTISYTLANLVEQRRNEERLKHIAGHDVLTGLPNRALFQMRLNEHLAMANRSGGEVVLMFLDLDRFKHVNDTMGHKAGDELLKEATRRILSCVRQYDLVARLGGDEFTIILPQLTQIHYVKFIARRILEELAKPFHLGAGEANISGSIGITVFPRDARDMESLLKQADTAMYFAKNAGRNAFCFFTEEMQTAAMDRLQKEEELRMALDGQEFVLHYQPKLDLATNQISSMEALVRWQKPNGDKIELVAPDGFIRLAEETGLIVPLGAWVLHAACQQNKLWQEQGLPPVRVAVNLSASQFSNPETLIEAVTQVLHKTQLDPGFLELEITESMVMENEAKAIHTMKVFQGMRIKMSVDDFGTGHSSLGSLKKFPIHTLKIDRTFVRDLASENSDEAAIVHAIISMAKSLHLRVVAEGVETEEQLAFLRQQGCDEIQGYYFSRPLPADDFAEFLQRHNKDRWTV
ncbi:MAG: EAL domain-containing protein [Magnetococcales bacterium]|nr:EAL domain-containing protein [Magnetococcales bacterium]